MREIVEGIRFHDSAFGVVSWHQTLASPVTDAWEDKTIRVLSLHDYRIVGEFTHKSDDDGSLSSRIWQVTAIAVKRSAMEQRNHKFLGACGLRIETFP